MYSHMKTTVELPDELLVAAKIRAAKARSTLRELIEQGLRQVLDDQSRPQEERYSRIRWVTVDGGLPPGVDLEDRAAMHDWIRRDR